MISLKSIQDCETNIPKCIWPVKNVEVTDNKFKRVIIKAKLPFWAMAAGGLLHAKCKRDIETMCAIHGVQNIKYKVIVQ